MRPWTFRSLWAYLRGDDNLNLTAFERWGIFYRMAKGWLARRRHFLRHGTYDPVPGKGV